MDSLTQIKIQENQSLFKLDYLLSIFLHSILIYSHLAPMMKSNLRNQFFRENSKSFKTKQNMRFLNLELDEYVLWMKMA
jgi:hypothetical protein